MVINADGFARVVCDRCRRMFAEPEKAVAIGFYLYCRECAQIFQIEAHITETVRDKAHFPSRIDELEHGC